MQGLFYGAVCKPTKEVFGSRVAMVATFVVSGACAHGIVHSLQPVRQLVVSTKRCVVKIDALLSFTVQSVFERCN